MKTMQRIIPLLIVFSICAFSVASAQEQTPDVTLREQIEAATTPQERIRLQLKLADQLVSTGHRSEALKELNLIAASDVFDPPSFYNLGNSFARLGESEPAIAADRRAIEQRKGGYSRAYNNLGVMLLRLGRWDEAYDALISALKIENFRYAEASYNLGRVYAARGQNDLAIREWRRALMVDAGHEAAKQALASVGTEERIVVVESKPAPVERKSVSTPGPLALDQISFDFLQRARNASERGKMLEAVENYRRVLSRQGGYFAPANLELSYALLKLQRYDEALGSLLEVSKRDGTRYPISFFHLARLYELKGDLKLAEAAFLQAANLSTPTNSQFLLDVIRVREKQGDFKGAVDALERYLALIQEHGQKPAWSDQRLAELRSKIK
jgi:tetratricopeptide (TPR) repeat protein